MERFRVSIRPSTINKYDEQLRELFELSDSSSLSLTEVQAGDFEDFDIEEFPEPEPDDSEEYYGMGWRNLCTAAHPWDENRRPCVCPLEAKDMARDFLNLELDGYLTHMIVATGISNLDLIPGTSSYGLTKLQLPGKQIRNIDVLKTYRLLQYVDLSYNKITDIEPLSKTPYLMVFDVSHNRLSMFVLQPPPLFLTYLNLSHNKFEKIPNFTPFWSLKHLNLSYNRITAVDGLGSLKYLNYLNLCHNRILVIEDLTNISLIDLDLSHNVIEKWEDIPESSPNCLYSLKNLNVSHNLLSNLRCFKNAYNLLSLNLAFNRILALKDVNDLSDLNLLRKLWLNGNKINTSIKDFRSLILYLMPNLQLFNGIHVTRNEKVSSKITYTFNIFMDELSNYCSKLVSHNLLPPPPFGEPVTLLPPNNGIVVLAGTPGCYNSKLLQMIAKKYPLYVRVIKLHTTLPADSNIEEGDNMCNFVHISLKEFNKMVKNGDFLYYTSRRGYKYGLTPNELKDDGRISVLASGIVCGLNLIWYGYRPTLIFIHTCDTKLFIKRVKLLYKHLIPDQEVISSVVSSSDEFTTNDEANDPENAIENVYHEMTEYDKKLENKALSPTRETPPPPVIREHPIYDWISTPSISYGDEANEEDNEYGDYDKLYETEEGEGEGGFEEEEEECFFNTDLYQKVDESKDYFINEESFLQIMLKGRQKYLEIHKNFPGLYMLGISSDDLDEAYKKILVQLRTIYNERDLQHEKININTESEGYKKLVGDNIKKMLESMLKQNKLMRSSSHTS